MEKNQCADALNWPQWTFSHYFLDLSLAVIFSCCSEFVFLFEFKEAQISDGWPTQIFSTQEAAELQISHLRSISVGLLFVLWVWFLSFLDNRACESSAFCSQLKEGGAFLRLIISSLKDHFKTKLMWLKATNKMVNQTHGTLYKCSPLNLHPFSASGFSCLSGRISWQIPIMHHGRCGLHRVVYCGTSPGFCSRFAAVDSSLCPSKNNEDANRYVLALLNTNIKCLPHWTTVYSPDSGCLY